MTGTAFRLDQTTSQYAFTQSEASPVAPMQPLLSTAPSHADDAQNSTSPQPTAPGVIETTKQHIRNNALGTILFGGAVSLYLGLGPAAGATYLGARVAVLAGNSLLAACKPNWSGGTIRLGSELLNVACLSAVAGIAFLTALDATIVVLAMVFCVLMGSIMLFSMCGVAYCLSANSE